MTQEEMDALMAGGDAALDGYEEEAVQVSGHSQKNLDGSDMVKELGSVTADSEVKATQIFDKLDEILVFVDDIEKLVSSDDKDTALAKISEVKNNIFEVMDTMQYQDIHRQKIERVINTMRSISRLMSDALDDVEQNIAPSAKHIIGDNDADVVDDDEIAKLVAQMNS